MRISKYAALMAAVALAMGGLLVFGVRAAQTDGAGGPRSGRLRERIREKLDLTEDQVSQIKNQLQGERDNIKSLLSRLHEARAQLRAEIRKAGATETSVREAAAKLSAVESDLAVERLKLYGKISPILTEEQRAKLGQFKAGIDQFIENVINRIDTKLPE
jgi:Spy/CpxP family protein refolding chaperone